MGNPIQAINDTRSPVCKHDFQGWRTFPDGNGGEQFCSKCGMGAQAWTLMNEFLIEPRAAYSETGEKEK